MATINMLEETANYLLNHCFVLGGVEDQRAKYLYVQDHLDEVRAVFAPLGFTDWRASTALITGFSAKEAVVSTMAVLTGTTVSTLGEALGAIFSPLAAFSFLTFTLLYSPCVAAIAAVKREMRSGWGAACVALFQCAVAWVCACLVYQIGSLFLR